MTSLRFKPTLALTDEGYVWVDVPVEVETDASGKIISERFITEAKERAAFLSLARTQHRLSWTYRKWALEARALGKTEDFTRYAAEARRLWRDCKEHISYARMRNAL